MYKFIILFICLCFLGSLSASKNSKINSHYHDRKRIIQGDYDSPSKPIPYQAALRLFHKDISLGTCGGSLITTNFVLTAAHCLYNCVVVQVGLGVKSLRDLKDSRVFMTSTKFLAHENYSKGIFGLNDIGIIELPKTVKTSHFIDVIKLPSKTNADDTYIGYKAKISGWGFYKNFKLSNRLKVLNTVIVAPDECHTFVIDPSHLICAFGEKGGRTCNGDSGGPLVIQNSDNTLTQVGLVSYGTHKCTKNTPSIYTRIARHLDWIDKNSDYEFNYVHVQPLKIHNKKCIQK